MMPTACQSTVCEQVGPPYAFHVSFDYQGGKQPLAVVVGADSGDFFFADLDPPWTSGRHARLDIEWGGAEPDGSPGSFTAFRGPDQPLVEVTLEAEQDAQGCPVTQQASAGSSAWW